MPNSKAAALLALRVALGWLMLVWGADKFANPAHGVAVADRFYFGLLGAPSLMPLLGGLLIALGALVIGGVLRRAAYPALLLVAGITLVGVWRSVLDPWGWYLERTNALFFPSLIVFAGALALHAFRDEDRLVLGRSRAGAPADRPGPSSNPATSRSTAEV